MKKNKADGRGSFHQKAIAQTYVYSPSERILHTSEAMIFLKHKDKIWNRRILDIGCGAGRTTYFLSKCTDQYIGIDYSREMVKACRERCENAECIQCDVRDMTRFQGKEFDFIFFSFNGLDYISHEDRKTALREVRRLLADDGVFVFSSHNKHYRNILRRPKFKRSANPVKLLRRLAAHLTQIKNFRKNRTHHLTTSGYDVQTDQAHNFSLLTYHTGKQHQIRQLGECGLTVREVYDPRGNLLDFDREEPDSPWLFFVAQKSDGPGGTETVHITPGNTRRNSGSPIGAEPSGKSF